MTPAEFAFPIGAVALYLYDSGALLWQNEMMYLHARGAWRVDGGSALRLAGRRVFLPNPLLPQRAQFQVRWHRADARSAGVAGEAPVAMQRALRPLGALNLLHVLLLAALAPVLWLTGASLFTLGVVALYYLVTLVALAIAWRRRGALRLPARGFWLLALDTLACAPLAANMVRRISMRHGLEGEPLRFAARHFGDAPLARVRALVEARVREEYAAPERVDHGEELLSALLPRLDRQESTCR